MLFNLNSYEQKVKVHKRWGVSFIVFSIVFRLGVDSVFAQDILAVSRFDLSMGLLRL